MADTKISAMASATAPAATDAFPLVQGGTNKKMTPVVLFGAGAVGNLPAYDASGLLVDSLQAVAAVTTAVGAAPLTRRLTADVTNATATLAGLTDLSVTLASAGKYVGRLVLKCNNNVAAEGVKLDFGGGGATATSFWAAGAELVGGTTVLGTVVATSLTGGINFSTITGETLIQVDFSIVVNAGGTFIPRAAENSHAAGTLTVELGSFLTVFPSAN